MSDVAALFAIIGVLVAISIPIFTTQLEKSRDAVTVSNMRAAYALARSSVLTESADADNNVTYTAPTGTADAKVVIKGLVAKGNADNFDFSTDESKELSGGSSVWIGCALMGQGKSKTFTMTFTYTDKGVLETVTATTA